jgi:hypothetical protein
MEFEKESEGKATVVVVDIHPRVDPEQDAFNQWVDEIDRWIARRLIEQSAEDVDLPPRDASGRTMKGIAWGFTERLADDPGLPDPTKIGAPGPERAIGEFKERLGDDFIAASNEDRSKLQKVVEPKISGYLADTEKQFSDDPQATVDELASRWKLARNIESFAEIKDGVVKFLVDQVVKVAHDAQKRLYNEREALKEWLQQTVSISGREAHRYWRFDLASTILYQYSSNDGKVAVPEGMLRQLAREHRIIVYAATPPEAYPGILNQWSAYAERIALEKPVAGLLEPV